MLDDKDPTTSRIVFQDKKREDQGLPAAGTSIHGVEADVTNPGEGTPSEYSCSLLLYQMFMWISVPLSSEEAADDTRKVGGQQESMSSGVLIPSRCLCTANAYQF